MMRQRIIKIIIEIKTIEMEEIIIEEDTRDGIKIIDRIIGMVKEGIIIIEGIIENIIENIIIGDRMVILETIIENMNIEIIEDKIIVIIISMIIGVDILIMR